MTQTPNGNAPQTPPGDAPPPPPSDTPDAPEPPAAAPGAAALVGPENSDAKTMAMLCHLLAIFTGWIAPLIIWLVKKNESKFVDQQGKEALNFELTVLIGVVVGIVTSFICVGVFILLAVQVLNIVFNILATIAVNKGQPYRYPFAIRFIS